MKKITINKQQTGKRIDKFLASSFAKASADKEEFFLYSRGEIIKNIKEGNVLVSGKKIKPSYILKESDVVELVFESVSKKIIPNKNIRLKIIYQDKNIIAIDKPAGLKVHPVSLKEKNTLVNGLLARFPEVENVNDNSKGSSLRPGIVHRLDQDTSGVMVVARNQESFDEFKKLFQNREITKKYTALVLGKLKNKKGVIEKPIAKASSYKKQIIANLKTKTKIRPAVTEYKVIKEFSDFSLIEAMPKTGRTHQIRVHMFSIGNPVAGDKKYTLQNRPKADLPDRQLLHAKELRFELFGKKYAFSAPMPDDFRAFLANID
jgi:23S rRNA pseudouridine1911/1915/1917 synthase